MLYGEDGVGGRNRKPFFCVKRNIRTFGIAGDWKATALESEICDETVTGGGRGFMVSWREEVVDAARLRQEKRTTTRLRKL